MELEGFVVAARRHRADDSGWGGVLVFVAVGIQDKAVLLETSETDERCWLTLHTDRGPYLFGAWYRPPAPGDTSGIDTLKKELEKHDESHLGVVLVGDMNVTAEGG